MMKGRIVIVYDTIYPFQKGGAEKRLYEIARGLCRLGWDVSWYGLNWWGGPSQRYLDGIELHGVGVAQNFREVDGSRRGIKGALRFCFDLMREDLPPDTCAVLVGQTPWIHYFAVRHLVARRNIPIVVDCWEIWRKHWIDYYGQIVGRFGMLIERLVLQRSDHLVAISDMTRTMIESQGVASEKISLAHNGVDLNSIKTTDASVDASDVIYFGRLVTHKNVDVLLKAAAILVRKKPNLRVYILGGGPELDNLKRIASTLGLENTVKFFGTMESHEEAMALLKASKVFVQPSTSEGGGSIALMEAYACGLPVIAITHPQGIDPALISHNVTGLWLPELSPELMVDALSQLLIDDIREPMRRPIEKMSENYDWQSICAVYDELFGLLTNQINPQKSGVY